ncbi:unnamed protein product [Calypogeia fissa]
MAHRCCSRRGSLQVGLVFLILLLSSKFQQASCQLKVSFYAKACPRAESLVKDTVSYAIFKDQSLAGSILRMLFHDCFTSGCDASILLNSVNGQQAEKDAPPNKNVRGYEVIAWAKGRVEAICPGVVSCADILAYAARDSVVLMGGQSWSVPVGRRDGMSSSANDANSNLPSFTASVAQLAASFQAKGLTVSEMVTLSGAHTLGGAACSSFSDRLYNFNSTYPQDPNLDPLYAQVLKSTCPQHGAASSATNTANLDVSTPDRFDNMYFKNLMSGKGLLSSDQMLSTDPKTKGNVHQLAGNNSVFLTKFAKAMVKMSAIGVLTGTQGQIRLNCSVING